MKKQYITYENYLKELSKEEIYKILDLYHLTYKKNQKKDIYISTILNSLEKIVLYTLDLFQKDEFNNIKYLIKKKGKVKIKSNIYLLNFLKTLEKNYLVKCANANEFIMPDDVFQLYKKNLKNVKAKILENTNEYNLILGFIDAYGVVDFDFFYNNYSKDYKISKDDALNRINNLKDFFHEFSIITDKKQKKDYIVSNNFKTLKSINKYTKLNKKYAIYTNNELVNIHNLEFINKTKEYKKLVKFINKHYEINKGSIKIVDKFIILPYLSLKQSDEDCADVLLQSLLDKYFENIKTNEKDKFIFYIKDIANIYPSWDLKGNIKGEEHV